MEKAEEIRLETVKRMLGRYFEGTSTTDEEQALREYFTGTAKIPAELKYARAMFGYFRQAAGQTGAQAVHPAQTLAGKDRSVEPRPRTPIKERHRGVINYLAGAVSAAAVIALIILFSPGRTSVGETVYCYIDGVPVTDPALAVEYSQRAFEHISQAVSGPLPPASVFNALEKLEYITELSGILGGTRPLIE